MGILDSIGGAVSHAIDAAKEAVGIDSPPAAAPPAAPAPEQATQPAAPPSARAMSGGFAAAQLQANMANAGPPSPAGVPYSLAARDDVHAGDPIFNDGKLDPGAVLSKMSQRDDLAGTVNDPDRCGATALVASAMQNGGKDGVLKLIDGLKPSLTKGAHAVGMDNQKELAAIRGKVANGTATHGDMAKLQEIVFSGYAAPDPASADGKMAISDADLHDLYVAGGMKPPATRGTPPDRMEPGQSWPLNIDLDGSGPHHWVVMGKDQSGKAYVYDPEATAGKPQIHYKGSPEYDAYLQRAGQGGSSFAPVTAAQTAEARRILAQQGGGD